MKTFLERLKIIFLRHFEIPNKTNSYGLNPWYLDNGLCNKVQKISKRSLSTMIPPVSYLSIIFQHEKFYHE